MKNKSATVIGAVIITTLGLVACSSDNGDDGSGSGELVWYAGMPERGSSRLAEKFEEDTGIKVNVLRESAGELVARVKGEAARPQADLIGVGTENLQVLINDGLIQPYEEADTSGIDDAFIDPSHHWFTESLSALTIGVNTERWESEFGDEEYPEDWDEMLNSEFKSDIVMPSPVTSGTAYSFVMNQLFRLGESGGWNYLDEFDDQVSEYTASGGAPSQRVASGENLMAISYSHDLINVKAGGFPVDLIYPEDTAYMIAGISIVEDAPNEENAQEFIDWILGQEAQQLYQDMIGGMSARDDVSQPEGTVPLDELSLVEYDADEAAEMRDETLDEFVERFDP